MQKHFTGGHFSFYFVSLKDAKACFRKLRKQKRHFLHTESTDGVLNYHLEITGSDYTFTSGDFKGKTVTKADSCTKTKI